MEYLVDVGVVILAAPYRSHRRSGEVVRVRYPILRRCLAAQGHRDRPIGTGSVDDV